MSGAMGDGTKFCALGQPYYGAIPGYYNAKKMSDLHTPGPSDCWVLTDEHPDSNDDATLFTSPSATNGIGQMVEFPGSMHGNAAGMVFADGHCEIHVWKDGRTTQPVTYITYLAGVNFNTYNQDLAWWANKTPAN